MELLGGALLGELPGVALQGAAPGMPEVGRRLSVTPPHVGSAEVPSPLARLAGADLDAVRWRWVSPGSWLRHVQIAGVGQLHLFKCSSNVVLPEHGHEGSELTMVLRGALSDSTGLYRPGDVCDLDQSIEHAPTAGTEGCICVVAQDSAVRFSSLIMRLARPWHGM
jgi:putative transcriptional regulator